MDHIENPLVTTLRDFAPHLVITLLLILNIICSLRSSRTQFAKNWRRHLAVLIPIVIFPTLIAGLGLALHGLQFNPDRGSFTVRTWPIYGVYLANIVYAIVATRTSEGLRWFMSSVFIAGLWVSLFFLALAVAIMSNNIAK